MTATVVGATGATGAHIVQQLLEHDNYQSVIVLARRPLGFEHEKLTVHVIDFDQPENWADLITGDELFSGLGTTLKQAGSKEAQYKVDVTYQLEVAKAARKNNVAKFLLISSPGANSKSNSFYLRMKGELDDAVRELDFPSCVLIKPSLIDSERPDGRPGEKLGSVVMHKLVKFVPPLRKYRPINASDLAKATINMAQQPLETPVAEVELDQIFDYL